MKKLIITLIIATVASEVMAAVGCTLNDPDRDIKRLFPKATNYRTEFITISERGGQEQLKAIENKLGDRFEPVYESIEVPYAYYTILSKKKVIGYVHGVNQKGRFGGMQLILATNTNGVIIDFYYQKITSPEAKKFRNKKFTGLFKTLCLKDFYTQDIRDKIEDPSDKNERDYLATLRGIKKNLILLDEFMLDNKYDEYFNKDKQEDNHSNNKKDNNHEDNKD